MGCDLALSHMPVISQFEGVALSFRQCGQGLSQAFLHFIEREIFST